MLFLESKNRHAKEDMFDARKSFMPREESYSPFLIRKCPRSLSAIGEFTPLQLLVSAVVTCKYNNDITMMYIITIIKSILSVNMQHT